MKSTIECEQILKYDIAKDLALIKNNVGTFKHANSFEELPDGYALIQEVPTRFGSTFDVTQRFIKSASRLTELVSAKTSDSSKKFNQLTQLNTNYKNCL